MSKREMFLKIGVGVGSILFPQVAAIEAAGKLFKSGGDKRDAVLSVVKEALSLSEDVLNKDLVNDEQFNMGLRMMNDGSVLIMKAVERHAPEPKVDTQGTAITGP